jgi:hypothetical protein
MMFFQNAKGRQGRACWFKRMEISAACFLETFFLDYIDQSPPNSSCGEGNHNSFSSSSAELEPSAYFVSVGHQ